MAKSILSGRAMRGIRLVSAAALMSALFALAIWLDATIDLQPYYAILAPIAVWLIAAEGTRPLFRRRWFWWTSIAFVSASALVVSYFDFAPRGSRLSRWLVIMMIEVTVFLFAVAIQRGRTGEGGAAH